MRLRWCVAALLSAAFLCAAACGKRGAGDEISIGEYGSLTGTTATFGISTDNAIKMAFEEVNAAGGVTGKKLKLFVEDDQSKPEEAATAATKLVNQNHVVALLGEVSSSRSLAAAPIAQAAEIPMVSPSSTNPRVTQVGDYIFRVCFTDPFQGAVMAKFANDTLKLKRVAILVDVRNDYSVGLQTFFRQNFKQMGGEIVAEQSYSEGDSDFHAQLTQIKAANPEAIYVPGYYTEVGTIARQARELGIAAPLLGGDGWDSPKLWEIGGEALNGSYFSNHYSTDDPSPVVQKFVTEYKKKYGAPARRAGRARLRRGEDPGRRDLAGRIDRRRQGPGRAGGHQGLPGSDRHDHDQQGPQCGQAGRHPQGREREVQLGRDDQARVGEAIAGCPSRAPESGAGASGAAAPASPSLRDPRGVTSGGGIR